MQKNKTIGLLVMVMFALTFIAPVTYASTLNDVRGHWADETITKMVGEKVIAGYPDGTFKPDNSITRAEFVSILNNVFGLTKSSGKVFSDTKTHWAKISIDIAVTNGV